MPAVNSKAHLISEEGGWTGTIHRVLLLYVRGYSFFFCKLNRGFSSAFHSAKKAALTHNITAAANVNFSMGSVAIMAYT